MQGRPRCKMRLVGLGHKGSGYCTQKRHTTHHAPTPHCKPTLATPTTTIPVAPKARGGLGGGQGYILHCSGGGGGSCRGWKGGLLVKLLEVCIGVVAAAGTGTAMVRKRSRS